MKNNRRSNWYWIYWVKYDPENNNANYYSWLKHKKKANKTLIMLTWLKANKIKLMRKFQKSWGLFDYYSIISKEEIKKFYFELISNTYFPK